MVISDGECPSCGATRLYLNTSDLFECPDCHLVCAYGGPLATVMPFLGQANFRLEDCRISSFQGVGFARSINGSVRPDCNEVFRSKKDILKYLRQLKSVAPAQPESQSLSEAFFLSFRKYILSCPVDEIRQAWASRPKRTAFYAHQMMPAIAQDLSLIHGKEEFKVDYVLSKMSTNGHAVPKIYIESENDFQSATHELRKLCSLNSPLRILVTVTTMEFLPKPASGAYKQLREWQSIVRSHNEQNLDFKGVLGIVVGRKIKSEIIFHGCAFKSNGDLLRPLSLLARVVA